MLRNEVKFKKYKQMLLLLLAPYTWAGTINDININNITTDAGSYIPEETYYSTIYTDELKTVTNGAVSWVESDVVAPGLKVVNNDDQNMTNCIMTSGINPDDASPKQCSDPFQSSKRIKMNTTSTGTEIDLVFDASISAGIQPYRVLEKYLNVTGFSISDFQIELGFNTGVNFQSATNGIGLDFSDSLGNIWAIDTFTGDVSSFNLDALFPAGLFGAIDPNHPIKGYFDPDERARFLLKANSRIIQSTGITSNYTDLVGNFLSKSQVMDGIFYDHDNDALTDPITIAHQTESGWISFRTDQFWIDIGLTEPPLIPGGTIEDATITAWFADPLFTSDAIEDLANLNLNYHITVGDISLWPTYDSKSSSATFTLRISSKSVIFANGFEEIIP